MERDQQQSKSTYSGEESELIVELLKGYREILQHDQNFQEDRIREVDKVLSRYSDYKKYCSTAEEMDKNAKCTLYRAYLISAANLLQKIAEYLGWGKGD